MTASPPAGYRYGPARIEARVDDPDAARWLDEFFSPWLAAAPSGPWDHCVRFTASQESFLALERAAARSALRPLPGFALDREVLALDGWRDAEAWHLFDVERRCFLRLRKGEVDVVAEQGSRAARLALMRTLRELAATRARRLPGWVDLHASAFEVGGRALLAIGPKQAGKTTLLVHALAALGAGLVANDRVFVEPADGALFVRGMPTAVRIRPGTLAEHPELRVGDRPGERPLLYHREEARERPGPPVDALTLAPPELARRLGVGCVAGAPLSAVVAVEIDPSAPGWSLERADGTSARRLLRAALYGGEAPRGETIFERELGGVAPAERVARAERIAAEMPVLRCRLGRDAYRTRVAGECLLDALLERARGEGS